MATSLFGVPQQSLRDTDPAARQWLLSAPQPRTPLDDQPAPRRRSGRDWVATIAFPLGIVMLGVALGVIAVVMLVAAGVPAPWESNP